MQRKVKIWTDTHISPSIAKWLNETFSNVEATSFYKLNFQVTSDFEIFMQAKRENVIFITKDKDYPNLLATFKAPPQLIMLKSGNLSNKELKELLSRGLDKCLNLILKHNYSLVELL